MEKFVKITGVVAPLPSLNIDTDAIIPKQFLTTVKRTGLGKNLFNDLRFTPDGKEVESFVLNKADYRSAKILVAGANFGCGSSREHAPWALADFGIRCVIASSFADIFFNNSFKNGLLLVKLPEEQVQQIIKLAEKPGTQITVDLENQHITGPDNLNITFEVDEFKRHCLLNGLDDISLTEQNLPAIAAFEEKIKKEQPWI